MRNEVKKWIEEDGQNFLKEIGINKDYTILDFGCNVGHYTIPVAKVVGKESKVYAVDKDSKALTQLMQTAKSEGLENIVPITTSGEFNINLKNESVDVVLLYDILHYINLKERRKLYNEVYRILKISGFLSIYPKHYKLDEPLGELSDTELESLIQEIENKNFCFNSKVFKKLIHDDNYDTGYILNFKPLNKK